MLDSGALLGLFSCKSFGSVQGICKLRMSFVYCGICEASSISLESHVQGHCVARRVLPVRDASRDFPVLLVLSCELPRWRPQNHWRGFCGATRNLFVFVLRRLERVDLSSGNLDYSFLFVFACDADRLVSKEFILGPFLLGH